MHYNLRRSKVTVIGMARSGLAAALLLKRLGAEVTVLDCADSKILRQNREMLLRENIKAKIKVNEAQFIEKSNLIVLSPGVSEESGTIKLAKRGDIPIISELELAFQNCRARIIAVTGTNGKTTVTTLIGEVLKANGKKAFVCGNIGTAFSSQALEAGDDDFIVLEVSSFQLEKIDEFRPRISLFLNFSPDHLDRYKSIQKYLAAKKRIYLNQDSDDWVVLNFADRTLRRLKNEIKSNVLFFNKPEDKARNFDSNQQAVMAVACLLKLDKKRCETILRNFKGIAHRMEFVRAISNIDFINDSKATNVEAARWALEKQEKPIILIAGGRDKGADFSQLKDIVREKVKYMFVIGESKNRLFRVFGSQTSVKKEDCLESATENAFKKAKTKDSILLSPMCASFDMFRDYEDRGDRFKQIVNRLAKSR